MAEDTPKGPLIHRRTLFKWAAVLGGAALVAEGTRRANDLLGSNIGQLEILENDFIKLGREEEIRINQYGIKWVPDGHVPYLTFPDGRKEYYISGNAASFVMSEDKVGLFIPMERDQQGKAISVVGPDRKLQYRNGYTAITSLLQLDKENPNHLFGITHNENWAINAAGFLDGGNFTATIGLLESVDGGKNWLDKGVVIKASDALEPGKKVTGVGQPCAIVKEEDGKQFVYVYYIYWPSYENPVHQIHLSRALLQDNTIGTFEHYTKDGFKSSVEVSPSTVIPVIAVPENIQNSKYTALPGVSYNTYLNRYLTTFETNAGFCTTTSEDGINWSNPQLILKFTKGQFPHKIGQVWASYPTLLSPDKPNDQITSQSGFLIYSKGIWDEPHHMVRIPFELK